MDIEGGLDPMSNSSEAFSVCVAPVVGALPPVLFTLEAVRNISALRRTFF